MVRVPEYTPNVALRPEFRQDFSVRATPDDMGAAIGRGMQQFAAGLDNAGDAINKVVDLENQTRAKDADNNFSGWLRERMYGENGFMLSEGRNAVDQRAAFEQEVEDKRKEFGADLPGGAGRYYSRASQARVQSTLQSAAVHTANQRKAWVTDASNARVDAFANDAMVNAGNPAAVQKNIAAGQAELRQQGALHGWAPEVQREKEQTFISSVHHNIALQIAQRDPIAAAEYVKTHTDQMTAKDRFALEKTLKGPIDRASTVQDATRILGGAPAPDAPPAAGPAAQALQNVPQPVEAGNIDINNRAVVKNPDGSISTEQSISVEHDGMEVLIPTVFDGKHHTNAEAIEHYKKTGEHLGKFKNAADADAYATALHNRQDEHYNAAPQVATVKPDARGNYRATDIARSMVGLNENTDASTISAFIRRNAGMEIDPRTTAWCAAFVNAVLGANGIKGTGKLNARSFLSFGVDATDAPQKGDIVVLSRGGDPTKGHVGFFDGFDQNGNVRILGGNQGNSVSVATFGRDQVLGFRRATAPGSDMPQPNQTVAGLEHIEAELAKVPIQRRDDVRKEIASQLQFKDAYLRRQREDVQQKSEQWLIANPSRSPDDLPLEVRQTLGVSGMATLKSWHDKAVAEGEPKTDDQTLYDLRTMYADDPHAFAQVDLFKYRDRLSNADWEKVNGWRMTARQDKGKAKQEGTKLGAAMTLANRQLEAAGIVKMPSKMTDADKQHLVRFQNALADEMDAFKRAHDGVGPDEAETQKIINRLMLPVVISSPGRFFGTNETKGFAFDARTRPDGATVDVQVPYEDIPIDLRRRITDNLERQLGRKPSPLEVANRYEAFVLDQSPPSITFDTRARVPVGP